jgi:hypothetical protein
MEGLLYLVIAVLLLGIVRFLGVFLHELSHALLALSYTQNTPVEVFIGSTGESITKGYKWKWGSRLHIYIQFAPWRLLGGLCHYSNTNLSWEKELKILLAGSFTSFSLMIVASLVIRYYGYGLENLLGNYLLLCAMIDFFTNLISRKKPFELYDGSTQLTDIDQIKKIFENQDIKMSQVVGMWFKPQKNKTGKSKKNKNKRGSNSSNIKGHRVSDN